MISKKGTINFKIEIENLRVNVKSMAVIQTTKVNS